MAYFNTSQAFSNTLRGTDSVWWGPECQRNLAGQRNLGNLASRDHSKSRDQTYFDNLNENSSQKEVEKRRSCSMIAITIRMLKMRFKAVFPPLLLFFRMACSIQASIRPFSRQRYGAACLYLLHWSQAQGYNMGIVCTPRRKFWPEVIRL